jgi:hypothetical protein
MTRPGSEFCVDVRLYICTLQPSVIKKPTVLPYSYATAAGIGSRRASPQIVPSTKPIHVPKAVWGVKDYSDVPKYSSNDFPPLPGKGSTSSMSALDKTNSWKNKGQGKVVWGRR